MGNEEAGRKADISLSTLLATTREAAKNQLLK
jgi:hypothetical protein